MSAPITCIFVEDTGRCRVDLRRYRFSAARCSANGGYCNALYPGYILDTPWKTDDEGCRLDFVGDECPKNDPRWPTKCDLCGEAFIEGDPYQHFTDSIYVEPATGRLWASRELPPGAMHFTPWLEERCTRDSVGSWHLGPDGHILTVYMPGGGQWIVDSKCSNCTRPDEPHDCWVRHGDPRDPKTLNVGKNGNTCAAGAGSIWMDMPRGWHGFLSNGELREC